MTGLHHAPLAEAAAHVAVTKHGQQSDGNLCLHALRELALQRHVVAHVELFDRRARQAGENGDQVELALGLVGRNLLSGQHVGDLRSAQRHRGDLLVVVFDRPVKPNLSCVRHSPFDLMSFRWDILQELTVQFEIVCQSTSQQFSGGVYPEDASAALT